MRLVHGEVVVAAGRTVVQGAAVVHGGFLAGQLERVARLVDASGGEFRQDEGGHGVSDVGPPLPGGQLGQGVLRGLGGGLQITGLQSALRA